MPRSVTVGVTRRGGRPIRIWVPVLPVLVLFLPIVALIGLAGAVACLAYHVSVARAVGAGWRVVSALPGTRVDLAQGHLALLIIIR